ncbi:MAG: IPTL-CTERM sorting domain-containing protein [Deltaproteobacteria bacterium]|nr:IPTL-CTERM sorting domain-containing protein [Deltaproteobacteria bacterium]MBF0525570.1 IPTL-CTERM sorting domain-containing protein [Deltaproteobacteria bacterium]
MSMKRLFLILACVCVVAAVHVSKTVMAIVVSPAAINLYTAGNYTILAEAHITTDSTIPLSSITGDIGIFPAAASFITGFGLIGTGTFSTSALVNGKVYAADYTEPTPTNLNTAVNDRQTAYVDGAGRAASVTNPGTGGNIGTLNLTTGVYAFDNVASISGGDLTLSGSSTDVWIFQIPSTFTVASNMNVILTGGAQARNVFWVVGDVVAIGTGAQMQGIILAASDITMTAGATLTGRALSHTQVTLISNTLTPPAPAPLPFNGTPTLNEWAMIIFTMLLGGTGIAIIRRQGKMV